MRPSIEQQQRSKKGVGQKQNLTSIRTEENSRKPNTAPGLQLASTPASQVHLAVVDPCSTTAAFSSVFDSGLAAARRSATCDPLPKASSAQAKGVTLTIPAFPQRRMTPVKNRCQ